MDHLEVAAQNADGRIHGAYRDCDHLFTLGKAIRRPHQSFGDIHIFPLGQDQGVGRSLLYNVTIRRRRIGRGAGSDVLRKAACRPCGQICRHCSRTGRTVGGAGRRVRHCVRNDVHGTALLESSSARPLHGLVRWTAGRNLHHVGSAILRHEHESRADIRLGLLRGDLEWSVDLPHCPTAWNAGGG
jgi:hypothetical protein